MDIPRKKLLFKSSVKILLLVLSLPVPVIVQAFTVTADLEVIVISNVGDTFQTVALDNDYTNAIPVCIYNLPSNASVPATVRISAITSNSFDVRIQNPFNRAVTSGNVHCLISDEGSYILPDGLKYEARTVNSNGTNGKERGWSLRQTENVTRKLTHEFDSPIVIGQVISSNDSRYSTFWSHGGDRRRPPKGSRISVGKQIGIDDDHRDDELLGFIVIESGTGSGNINGIDYYSALGSDIIVGVNSAAVSYSLAETFNHGIATISAMDSTDGGWAVLLDESPLENAAISLGIDEDGNRSHSTEQVAYWVFDTVDVADLDVTIDDGISDYEPGETVAYTITIKNNGPNDASIVNILNNAPEGTTNSEWSCAGVSCPNPVGTDNIDEVASTLKNADTLVYTVNVSIPADRTGMLVNKVRVSNVNVDPVNTNDLASDINDQSTTTVNSVKVSSSGAGLWLSVSILFFLFRIEQGKKKEVLEMQG